RKVYRVAVACAIVGWLLIRIATQVFPFFHIPDWTVRVLVLLVLAGFPIALARDGIRRSGNPDAEVTTINAETRPRQQAGGSTGCTAVACGRSAP
ncbi:MAG: hypothetical protein ACREPZ_11970, partial [Rhodanobacteraceae bacterium]